MPKSDLPFDPDDYAPVAERIALFYARHPEGRIVTELLSPIGSDEVVVRACVYRAQGDTLPAATGLASERKNDGEINAVACLENTETSAIGRALANLGLTAARRRPSREEMEKADRVRTAKRSRVSEPAAEFQAARPQPTGAGETSSDTTASRPPIADARQGRDPGREALDRLLDTARRAGVPDRELNLIRARLDRSLGLSAEAREEMAAELRGELMRRMRALTEPPDS